MKIVLNGEEMSIEDGLTLKELVERLADDPRGVAIERNLEIVPRGEHGSILLEAGDRLELVQFVGGG
ncbi:MAG: sulfur carrier protein ThiS [Pseudomonadota bacterium]